MPAASRTAVGVAALRAAHVLHDAPPPILNDVVAIQLIDPDMRARLEGPGAAEHLAKAEALRVHVVVRSRFAEDCLEAAFERGVRQYVILGAGLDTFAWRQPAWASGLRIFEVDQAGSQLDKQDRVARAGLAAPPNLVFVPVDFETEPLGQCLSGAGVDLRAPVFFSWLGVTPYLDEAAIDDVLRVVVGGAPGTEVVFTFAPVGDTPSAVAAMAAALGEVFRILLHAGTTRRQAAWPGIRRGVLPHAGGSDRAVFREPRRRADGPAPRLDRSRPRLTV